MPLDLENEETKEELEALWASREEELRGSISTDLKSEMEVDFKNQLQGLVENKEKLLEEAKQAKEEARQLKSVFGNRDPEDVKALVKQLENEELMKLVQEGDLEGYNKRITDGFRADFEGKLENAHQATEQAAQENAQLKETIKQLRIDDVMKSEFINSEGEPGAIGDMIMRARQVFDLDEFNQPVAKDGRGEFMKGKDGLLTPSEWMQDHLRVEAYLLFKRPQGSGAPGSSPTSGALPPGSKNRSDMTSQEKGEYMLEHGAAAYQNLPA